jgi:hypothetical protein
LRPSLSITVSIVAKVLPVKDKFRSLWSLGENFS